jgi:hypothetical protein
MSIDLLKCLPLDLRLCIFSQLDAKSLLRCCQVCTAWRQALLQETAWKDPEAYRVWQARIAYITTRRRHEALEKESTPGDYFVSRSSSLVKSVLKILPPIQSAITRQEESKKLLDEFNKLHQIYKVLKITQQGRDHILGLFGGWAQFEKLPVFKGTDCFFIPPKSMTAPIMRGRNQYACEFFVIRAKAISASKEEMLTQIFFQRMKNCPEWGDVTAAPPIIKTLSLLIDGEGKIGSHNQESYKELATLISKGTLTRTSVDPPQEKWTFVLV